VTSTGLLKDGPGRVFVDLDVPWDNEFPVSPGPDVVLAAVTDQLPAEMAKLPFEVTAFHLSSLHQ
jgi:hypothetical protein